MRSSRFEVLSPQEVRQIDAASMHILENTGLRVNLARARDVFREAGARVDEAEKRVRLPERLVREAIARAPGRFTLYGADPEFRLEIGTEATHFAALGTPTRLIDPDSGALRPITLEDLRTHLRLIDGLDHIHNSQMDLWPNDIPMTTIHVEAILAWAQSSRKSFGMGCYGVMASDDMMRMMAIAVGGKEELQRRPRFFAICSVMTPLQMINLQLEGLFAFAEYRQPMAMSPEAMAGTTAPVTLAGLLAQQNAEVLAHLALAQLVSPGTPVLYAATTAFPAGPSAERPRQRRSTRSASRSGRARCSPPSWPGSISSPAAGRSSRPWSRATPCSSSTTSSARGRYAWRAASR
jgi:trimethylamine--corrinoid protein Co-methyltransferase